MAEIGENLAVGAETVERPLDFPDQNANILYLQKVAENAAYGDNLYGLKLALEFGVGSKEVRQYYQTQETTHVQEGIELLSQEDSTYFVFENNQVLSPIINEPMTKLAQQGHEAQKRQIEEDSKRSPEERKGLAFMVTRTGHDRVIAEDNNRRMADSPIGSAWLRFTPFAEEESVKDAIDAGFWPKQRRAYAWLYRKVDDKTLEATIITIDQSDVTAFSGLMHDLGSDLPADITSHDIPGYAVELEESIVSDEDKDQVVKMIKQRYREYANVVDAKGIDMTSKEFVEQFAMSDIASLVRLQQEIISSMIVGELAPYARTAGEAVLKQDFLTDEERRLITFAINSSRPISQIDGLGLIMKAHRYGVWKSINTKVTRMLNETVNQTAVTAGSGMDLSYQEYLLSQQQQASQNYVLGQEASVQDNHQLNSNTASAQKAAERGEVAPGCPGGSSFLSQTEAEAKEGIFGGKEKDPKRWMSCPFCNKKEAVKARVCDTDLKCRHCAAEVKKGKVVSTGIKPEQQPKEDPAVGRKEELDEGAVINLREEPAQKISNTSASSMPIAS